MMKSIKMLGLAVLAAMALTAVAAASSASATVLCSENTPQCKLESIRFSGTPISAKLKSGSNFVIANEGLVGNETCTGSSLTAITTATEGSPLSLTVTGLTLSGCGKCEKVEAKNLSYSASVEQTGSGNGTLNVGGKPSFKYTSCPLGISCTFNASSIPLTFEGGNPANLVAKEVEVTRDASSSGLCPATGKLSATYEITSPTPLYAVAGRVVKEAKTTSLCSQAVESCPAEKRYSAGSALEAALTKFTMIKGGLNVECSGGSTAGQLSANSGEPSLPLKLNSMTMSSCNYCHTRSVINTPYEASLKATGGGNGILTTKFEMHESGCVWGFEEFECTYGGNVSLEFLGDNLAPKLVLQKIGSGGQELKKLSGTPGRCAETAQITANYSVTSPKPVWVTES
jgi:hypothetical protein